MPKNVLLIHCPFASVSLPPMGVAYIAAYLEAYGIACDVLDLNVLFYTRSTAENRRLWDEESSPRWEDERFFGEIEALFSDQIQCWADHVIKQGYRTVGFSLTGGNLLFAIALSRKIKAVKPSVCIVYGGPTVHVKHYRSELPFRFLSSPLTGKLLVDRSTVDYIVLGEGERAMLDIVQAFEAGRAVDHPSVMTTDSKKFDRRLSFLECLDDFPFPAWEKFSLNQYTVRAELPILFSRGCVNHCSFCNDWLIWNGKYRYRSAKNIFLEMKMMNRRFAKRSLRCNDLMFNGDLKVLDELAGLLIASGIDVNWGGQGVIRTDMSDRLLQRMREAGLRDIVYGVESLSDSVLEKMRKPFRFDDVLLVLRRTKAAGIRTHINLIAGFPGESEEDHRLTLERLAILAPALDSVANINCCRLMADSPIESSLEHFGIACKTGAEMSDDWVTMDGSNNPEVRQRRKEDIERVVRAAGIKRSIEPVETPAEKKSAPPKKFFWHKVFSVFLGVVLALALLELALRVAGFGYNLYYRPPEDLKAGFRIFCVGESSTWGVGATDPLKNGYPAQLEKLLNRDFPGLDARCSFENAIGQNTSEILFKLPKHIRKYRPHLVILMVGANNYWNMETSNIFLFGRSEFHKFCFKGMIFLDSFRVWKLLKNIVFSLGFFPDRAVYFFPADGWKKMERRDRLIGRDVFDKLLAYDVGEMLRILRANHIKILLCTYPVQERDRDQILRDLGKTYGVPVADNGAAFSRLTPLKDYLSEDHWHPNDRGYVFLAENIFKTIVEQQMIERKSGS